MKNCVKDVEAIELAKNGIKKIIDTVGKVNLVFPAYKVAEEELKKNYRAFAEAIARKNLIKYDEMTQKNRRMVEVYELSAALREIIEELLAEIKTMNCKEKSFLVAACIL